MCREHELLEARYHSDVMVCRDAARRLGSCQPREFNRINEDAERARAAFKNAREALNKHLAEHGCG
jgi:hypothetical protein